LQQKAHNTIAEYVRSFQNGEEKGFGFFFREYYAALCYFSFQIIKDKSVAEEIVGDAFIKLWERHSSFENACNVKSFLYRTVHNASIDWTRRKKTKIKHIKELTNQATDREGYILEKMIEAEVYREIIASLKVLPPKCRQVFSMFYLEGKDYSQIADELTLSINTIRVQKARALTLLRKQLTVCLILSMFLG
jgi:RNA polymerase sigma-70 factor (family 1)